MTCVAPKSNSHLTNFTQFWSISYTKLSQKSFQFFIKPTHNSGFLTARFGNYEFKTSIYWWIDLSDANEIFEILNFPLVKDFLTALSSNRWPYSFHSTSGLCAISRFHILVPLKSALLIHLHVPKIPFVLIRTAMSQPGTANCSWPLS